MEEHHLIRLTQMILLLGLKTIYTLMQNIAFGNGLIAKENKTKNKNKNTVTQRVIHNIISIEQNIWNWSLKYSLFLFFFGTIPTSDM